MFNKRLKCSLGAVLDEKVKIIFCFHYALHFYYILVITFFKTVYLLLELTLLVYIGKNVLFRKVRGITLAATGCICWL